MDIKAPLDLFKVRRLKRSHLVGVSLSALFFAYMIVDNNHCHKERSGHVHEAPYDHDGRCNLVNNCEIVIVINEWKYGPDVQA